ncbi:acyl-CoA carboxylase subunit beta [Ilumatobacter nonamiensis]|uniref:acyl-CoA carboxylase subunit beta n=1 Tax=Ilumatobacter nonamiensis TaxID=467093 RepID=UPI0003468FE2|nr:carboxyl transferase domain-containing protein [Ilumatobacter nonamiensis]
MTDLDDAVDTFGLDRFVPGLAQSEVRVIADDDRGLPDRSVIWIEFDDDDDPARLDEATGSQLERGIAAALDHRLPLVVVISTTGSDIVEGMAALNGWGRVARTLTACSGLVPTIVIVDGPAVSGPALLLGLADFTIMTERSSAFVNGPVMVEEFTGVAMDVDELGGSATHARYTGVATFVVPDRAAATHTALELLGYLPDSVDAEPTRWPQFDPGDRPCPEAGAQIPESSTGSYDVRKVAAAIADEDSVLEVRDRWAANAVTAFATIDGRPVGILANQPMVLAGTLDIPASQKAARFVAFCDAFNLPIITLVDTPGFYPGKDLEWRGMIRHGAQLVYAYARADVPRICVILRKSYGGAYIVMDSKTMGNDLCLAWPWAEIAVMGAGQAAAILARRASPEEKAEFEADYAERLLNPYVAAERGFIDGVIDPAETRAEISAALHVLADKREALGERKHGNTPL